MMTNPSRMRLRGSDIAQGPRTRIRSERAALVSVPQRACAVIDTVLAEGIVTVTDSEDMGSEQ